METKEMYQIQEREKTLLNRFVGHKMEVTCANSSVTFHYQNFNWETDEDSLVLFDDSEQPCKTYIPLSNLKSICNIISDIYDDALDIRYGNSTISICCAEDRPISPICNKCGKELLNSQWWELNQVAPYDSSYDGDIVTVRLCDDCFMESIGQVVSVEVKVGNYNE